jgi:Fungal specific transcription factor domain
LAKVAAPEAVLTADAGSFEERRALDFFCRYTARQFPGLFLDDFWNRLLQLSNIEPAIRHAAIAVGTIHEQYGMYGAEVVSVPDNPTESSHRFAVLEYNKATNTLVKRLSADSNSVLTTVAACLLFISIEFLRGEVEMALKHLHSGLDILKTWRDGPRSSAESPMVEEEILPVFERLSMTSTLFGRPADQLYDDVVTLPSAEVTFDSLSGARKSLVGLVNLSLQFIRSVMGRKNRFEVVFEDIVQQTHLEGLLHKWEQSFEVLIRRRQWTQLERNSISLLRIHQKSILIWLLTSLSPNETSFDQYNEIFESAINVATVELVDAFADPSTPGRPPNFSFEMQFIAPLYFIAIKCRVGWIRRRAIDILSKAASKEGPWDSRRSARVAGRVMALEESGLDRSLGRDLPPEWSRIHHAEIKCDKHPVTGEQLVEFLSKPNGLHGEWKLHREYMVL